MTRDTDVEPPEDAVLVRVEDIDDISRPGAGTQVTDVVITNIGDTNWIPSTQPASYLISPADGNIAVVAATAGTSCLTGSAVSSGASCAIGIQTNAITTTQTYTLQALAASEDDGNLSQESNSVSFDVTGSLGSLRYTGPDVANNEITLTAAADPITVTLENIGDTVVTGLDFTVSDGLLVTNPGGGGEYCNTPIISLAAQDSCVFALSSAVAGSYVFTSEGLTNTPPVSADLAVTVEVAAVDACGGDNPSCRAFVTGDGTDAGEYSGTGDFSSWSSDFNPSGATGIQGANSICSQYAEDVLGITDNPQRFKAWVSTTDQNASGNILYNPRIEYVRADDTDTVIASPGGLVTGTLANAISSIAPAYAAWTGTKPDGSLLSSDQTCQSWSAGTFPPVASKGSANATGSSWTYDTSINDSGFGPGVASCANDGFLYCLEAPESDSECTGPNPTCRAFVTASTHDGNLDGLQSADAKCQSDANNPGGGVFKAWLSAPSYNAKNRIGYTDSTTYVRASDTSITIADAGVLLSGTLAAAITDEPGSAWTATVANGDFSSANSCSSWTNAAADFNADVGDPAQINSNWTNNGLSTCDVENHLICFEVPQ